MATPAKIIDPCRQLVFDINAFIQVKFQPLSYRITFDNKAGSSR